MPFISSNLNHKWLHKMRIKEFMDTYPSLIINIYFIIYQKRNALDIYYTPCGTRLRNLQFARL